MKNICFFLAIIFNINVLFSQNTKQYHFNVLNQLIKVDFGYGKTITYTYDELGNRISMVVNDGIPENLPISNLILTNGANECFNAYDTITVAGGGTNVEFESGSTVDLIAGQAIFLLQGFHASEGSLVQAYITTDGIFCGGVSGITIADQPAEKSLEKETLPEKQAVATSQKSVKVYPNPNNGQFTLEFSNVEIGATIRIYNLIGALMYHSTATSQTSNKVNLPKIRRGIYFVKVTDGREQFTKKMIVN
jgi:YD repeat-containing protein